MLGNDNFIVNHNFILTPIVVGNDTIKSVPNCKLFGIIISSDLNWTCHIECAAKKASKALSSLRILKCSGVPQRPNS